MGHCKIMFINGDTAIIYYEIKLGYSMEGTFKCISGTGRYEGIECSGTTGYTQIKSAQEGRIHATNYYRGTYTCLLYTSPSPRDQRGSRMPSSA